MVSTEAMNAAIAAGGSGRRLDDGDAVAAIDNMVRVTRSAKPMDKKSLINDGHQGSRLECSPGQDATSGA